ncbi:MAG: hypothetical protein HUU55_12245 [Myxococcales bacterium]|nr:hypothetical protein [Myxococcales bacterium]
MNEKLRTGNLQEAVAAINEAMDVQTADDLPERLGGDAGLMLAERGMLKLAARDYIGASKDFRVADSSLEVLDLTTDVAGNIGRYLFSDDSGVYVAPAIEKVLLNTMNMLSFLCVGDLESSRVEARRAKIIQSFLDQDELECCSLNGLTSYLSGIVYEWSNRPDDALRFYGEALRLSVFPSLERPVQRLSKLSGYRTPEINEILSRNPLYGADNIEEAEILVVVMGGRVPHREAERLPIGLALTYAATSGRHRMSDSQREQANLLAARGALTWVNFPSLQPTSSPYPDPVVLVDGSPVSQELAVDVSSKITNSFERIRPVAIIAAITRAVARIVAGIGTDQATQKGSGNKGLAALLGLAIQGALTAADTPDTRSWVTLPEKIWVSRTRLPAGRVELTLRASGAPHAVSETITLNLTNGEFHTVVYYPIR